MGRMLESVCPIVTMWSRLGPCQFHLLPPSWAPWIQPHGTVPRPTGSVLSQAWALHTRVLCLHNPHTFIVTRAVINSQNHYSVYAHKRL